MHTDNEHYLGYLISDAARLMRTVFDRRVRALGLTRAQWLVLSRLHRCPGSSQSELADMIEVEKATAGKHIDRLERKGWVVRRADPADRRVNRLYLTPGAERVQKKMWRIARVTVDDALVDLDQAEATELARLMAAVKARLQELAGQDNGRRSKSLASRSSRKRRPPRGDGAAVSDTANADADEALVS